MFTIENMQVPLQIHTLASGPSSEFQELFIPPLDLLNEKAQSLEDAFLPSLSPLGAHQVRFVPLLSPPVPDDGCSPWLNPETLPAKDNRKIFPDQLNMAYWRLQTHFGVNPWSPDSVIQFNSPVGLQDAITACVYNLEDGTSVVGVRFGVGSGEVQLDLLGIVRDLYSKVVGGIPEPIGDSDAHRLQTQIWGFVWDMFPVVSSANSTPPVGGFDDLSATSPKLTKTLFLSGENTNGLVIPSPKYIGLDGSPAYKIPLEKIIEILTAHVSYPVYPIIPGDGDDGITLTGTNPATMATFCSNASGGSIERVFLEVSPFLAVRNIHEVLYNRPFLDDVNPIDFSIWRAGSVIACYSPTETPGEGQVLLYAGGPVDVNRMTDFILQSMGLGPDSWSPIKTELNNLGLGTHIYLPTTSEGGETFVVLGGYYLELPQFMRILAAHTLPNEAGIIGSLKETWGSITCNSIIGVLALLTVLRFMRKSWDDTVGRMLNM